MIKACSISHGMQYPQYEIKNTFYYDFEAQLKVHEFTKFLEMSLQ